MAEGEDASAGPINWFVWLAAWLWSRRRYLNPLATPVLLADDIEPLLPWDILRIPTSEEQPRFWGSSKQVEILEVIDALASGFYMAITLISVRLYRTCDWFGIVLCVTFIYLGLVVKEITERSKKKIKDHYLKRKIKAQTEEKGEAESRYPSSLNWLNNIVRVYWLNYRALVSHYFIFKIWPVYKEEIREKIGNSLHVEFKALEIGDRPPKIESINTSIESEEVIVDVKVRRI